MPVGRNPLISEMLETKAAVQVVDAAKTPGYLDRSDPGAVGTVDLGGARTCLSVPMLKENELIGEITIVPRRGAALYRQADRAVAELRRPGRHRHREHAAAERIARVAGAADRDRRSAGRDQRVAWRPPACVRGDGGKGAAIMSRRTQDISHFRWRRLSKCCGLGDVAGDGGRSSGRCHTRPAAGRPVGRALAERRPVQISDIGADNEHIGREAADKGFIRTILRVPLLREGEAIGAFGLSRQRVELFS